MKFRMSAALWAALFLFPAHAFAQGAVQQSGAVTPGDAVKWVYNGIIADAGTAALQQYGSVTPGHAAAWISNPLTGITQLGDAGTAAAPVVTSLGIIGSGTPFCVYDAPVASPNHEECFGVSGTIATITAAANNGASLTGLQFLVGGNTITVPITTGELLNGISGINGLAVGGSAPAPTIGLASISSPQILANITGVAAPPGPTTLSPILDASLGNTPGDLPYRTSSAWGVLGPGANGACLTYSTTGPTLIWGSCSGSPSSGTVTSVATNNGLTGGTITTTGTIGLAAIADADLLSNISGGSAAPTANTLTGTIDYAIGSGRGSLMERGSGGWSALAPGTANYVFVGKGSGADPAYVTLTSEIDAAFGNTRGSILERGASGWTLIAPGTSGYVLTSQGSGADPAYATSAPTSTQITTALGYTPATNATIGSYKGVSSFGGTVTLTSGYCGQLIETTGSSSYTITLPSPGANAACVMTFINDYAVSTATVTLATPSGAFHYSGGTLGSTTTFASACGGMLQIVSDGANWFSTFTQGGNQTCVGAGGGSSGGGYELAVAKLAGTG